MDYESVLDLTVTQIAALLTEESSPPGLLDYETYQKFMKANENG